MKKYCKIILFLLFLILIKDNLVFSQDEKVSVESNGLVQKSSSGFNIDRKLAIIAALREAVEKACGVTIKSKTQVEDFVVVKDVINTELSNLNNELIMSEYRIVFEPRGYTRIDNSDMLEVKLEVNFKKRNESANSVINSSKKQKTQQKQQPVTPSNLYCCDVFGIARCPMAIPGPIGTSCFCPGQGWGIICGYQAK